MLEHIEREKIMPPLGVIQVLSRNGVASVGLVKQWLMTRIKESREEIHTVRFFSPIGRFELMLYCMAGPTTHQLVSVGD